ncbi:glycoside hydrolase family 16 protein [Bradyrhizobium sp. WYCCWR 12699]|uniref:glycoside hydrolase family 16 protein n=1 Tax=Bradyrhizobium sp. WYCCWR 12699 TaxID=3064203 RepID=UPI0028A429FB|nr:glycoside hydrolase family 16 protein [Bradyrhizobium sp. WYCCWR 12699]MDT4743660.1 glycoside hydrolase family 16 protein [Bradyrhizobium sp. WYCCWR 12699]
MKTRFLLFIIALVAIGQRTAAANPDGSSIPAEVTTQGYTRVIFQDDFTGLDLDTPGKQANTWYNALWYQNPRPASQIQATDGILTITTPPGNTETPITTVPRRGGGGVTFHHGFFEARMRFANDDLDWSAFWLFSRPHSLGTDNDHWCEIDVFENFGPNLFVGSVHDWTKKTHVRNTNARYKFPHNVDFSTWHNYGLLWTPEKLTWFFDSVPVIEAKPPEICEQQDMFLILGSYKHKDGPQHQLDVDWVRVLSR